MSILGVKKNVEKDISNLQSELRKMETANRDLRRNVAGLTIRVLNVENKPDQKTISISAGIEGSIRANQKFNFGDGGGSYFVMNFPGRILGMSLVSLKTNVDDVAVMMTANNNDLYGYGMSLSGSAAHGYRNFDTPFEVKAGDMIGFVSKSDNAACINTLVSAVIELFL